MKTLLLFIALTAPMLAQDKQHTADSLGALMARVVSEPLTWKIDCVVRIVAPSGRVVGWTKEQRSDNYIQRDSVLTTGCPVCGSDQRKTWHVEVRVWEPDTMGFQPPTKVKLEKRTWFTVDGVRYSVCADCGTVYHGRRK